MKKVYLLLAVLAFPLIGNAMDFYSIKTPFFAKIEISKGGSSMILDTHYDGVSKLFALGPTPQGASGPIRIYGNLKTNEIYTWQENDPKKIMMKLNLIGLAESFGIDTADVMKNGTLVGEKQFLGEPCQHWQQEVSLESNQEAGKHVIETCVTDDGIPLWGKENGQLVAQVTLLERGPQSNDLFIYPADHQIFDMSAMMEKLQKLLNSTTN